MICYIHYLISNDGKRSKDIFEEIYHRLTISNLIEKLEDIKIVTIGDKSKLDFDDSKYQKCTIIDHVDDISQHEFPTLMKIKEHSQNLNDDVKILYLHLKGITSKQDAWRKDMLNIVVDRHEECMSFLDEYHAVGTKLTKPYIVNNKTPIHFSGNFWWTTAKHIKNLPDPSIDFLLKEYEFLISNRKDKKKNDYVLHSYRYLAEYWIGLLDIDLDLEENHKLKEIK